MKARLQAALVAATDIGITLAAISRQSGVPEASLSQFRLKGAMGDQYCELLRGWLADKELLKDDSDPPPAPISGERTALHTAFIDALKQGHSITGIATRSRVPRRSLSNFKKHGVLGNRKGYSDRLRTWLENTGFLPKEPMTFRDHAREPAPPVFGRLPRPTEDIAIEDIVRAQIEAQRKGLVRAAEQLGTLAQEFIQAQDARCLVASRFEEVCRILDRPKDPEETAERRRIVPEGVKAFYGREPDLGGGKPNHPPGK